MSCQNQQDDTQRERIYICKTAKDGDDNQRISIKLRGSIDVIEGVLEEIRGFASISKLFPKPKPTPLQQYIIQQFHKKITHNFLRNTANQKERITCKKILPPIRDNNHK